MGAFFTGLRLALNSGVGQYGRSVNSGVKKHLPARAGRTKDADLEFDKGAGVNIPTLAKLKCAT